MCYTGTQKRALADQSEEAHVVVAVEGGIDLQGVVDEGRVAHLWPQLLRLPGKRSKPD